MNALGGVLGPPECPVESHRVVRMAASLARRCPGGLDVAWGSAIALVLRSRPAAAPRRWKRDVSGRGRVLLQWDGRLDNREELGRELGLGDREAQSEGALLAAAYERWGARFPAKLVGDFALAVWDGRRRRLLLARDRFGVRPLFHCRLGPLFLWASSLGALLDQGADPALDDDFVADYLTYTRFSDLTPHRSIRAVPPGSVVRIEDGESRVLRYWPDSRGGEIRYPTDREYEEHFDDLFQSAVGCRLRDETAFAELSGGVDSSAIVVVADEILAQGRCRSKRLETVSYVFDQASTSDERRYSACIEQWRSQSGHHVREDDFRLLRPLDDDVRIEVPTTELFFAQRNRAVQEILERKGSRTLLRGIGGDQALWGQSPYPFELADHLSRLHLVRLARSLSRWSRAEQSSRLHLLLGGALFPLMPHRWRATIVNGLQAPEWFDRRWLRKVGLGSRMTGPRDGGGLPRPSQREHFRFLQGLAISASWGGYFVPRGSVEVTYPFLDARLVDFALRIPITQMARPRETRSILRRTLRSRMPEKILNRHSKAGPDEALLRALDREWDRLAPLFQKPLVSEHGFVDREAFRHALTMARHGRVSDGPMLFRIIALEWWLRSLERRKSAPGSGGSLRKEVRPDADPENRDVQCA